MLKKWLSVLVVMSIFCLSYVKEGWTAAFEGPGVCVRPLTMGGAFIGLADDWSAVIWNPAGLTQLEGKGFGFSLDYVPAEASDGNSVANNILNPPTYPNPDQGDIFFQLPHTGSEPANFTKTDVKSTVYLPTLAGYTKFKGFHIAGALYVPMGYSSTWEDTVGSVSAKYKFECYETIYNISAAKEIIPNLSMGLGVNFLSWKAEKKADKSTPVYTYNFKMEGDGLDMEGVLSLLYKYKENFRLGAVYRTGSKVNIKGDAKTTYPFPVGPPPLWAYLTEESDATQKLSVPAIYLLGIAYKPMPNLTLTADWNRTDWSKQKRELTFSPQGTNFFKDKNEDLGWKDADKIRLGAEYTLNELWKLRAGFFTDPSPIPDKAVSLTNLIDIDRVFYSLGAGYNCNNWQIDMGILHNKEDQTIEGVTYEKKCTSLHTAISRQF